MLVSDSAASRRSDLGSNDEASFGACPSSADGFTTRGFTILDPEKGFGDPSMKDSVRSSSEFRSRQADHTDGERGISDFRLCGKMACGPETGGSARRDGPRSKMLTFRCAPWKQVRTFEGILGVFQDAHFSKTVSIFEQGAHLRRKRVSCSAPCPNSASCLCFLNLLLIFLDDIRAPPGAANLRPLRSLRTKLRLQLSGRNPSEHCSQNKKSRAWNLIRARLRLCEIYSLSLYRIF
jgi:hypothetical protein